VSRRSSGKAVVIGASGHLGNAIVRALLNNNYQVTACSRRAAPPANLAGLKVRYASGDADSSGQFDKWITGHDLVVDAAAPYPLNVFSPVSEAGKDPIAYAERRTRQLLGAVRRHKARLAYVGSFVTHVHPLTSGQRFQHKMMRLAHPYFEVKELIEAQMLDAGRYGIDVVIVNPTYCLGPWDLRDRLICTIPLLLAGAIPSSISQTLNVVDVRDVAAATIAALDAKRYGDPIQMDGHNISTAALYALICELGGVRPPRFSTAAGFALAGAYALEVVQGIVGERVLVPSGGMMMAALFDYMAAGHELEKLGSAPRPISESVTDAIKWYRQIGYC